MAASSGDHFTGGEASGGDGACSTPFVSAPSSPARDASFCGPAAAGCFYSAPASPARGGPDDGDNYGCELGLDSDFDFEFSSRISSSAAAAMSSADELFHNGQIRPMRLASLLLRLQALPPLAGEPAVLHQPEPSVAAPPDERGRFRSRSVHRRSRSHSPFRTQWLSPSSSPAPAANSGEPPAGEVAPSASRSSSSSSTASSASSSSSRSFRRWGFFKDLLHRSKSDGGKRPPLHSPPPPAPKRNPSPAVARGRGRTRTSAHARLYEARRAEAEEMRRRTFLPYQQGLLLGCLGLSSRGYGAMHSVATAAKSRP